MKGRMLRSRNSGAITFLILLAVILEPLNSRFLSPSNLKTILFTAAILAIAACAQGVVVLTRSLDISIGAVMAVAAYVPMLLVMRGALPGALVIPLGLALGAACGVINGFLVGFLRIPAIVATLGTMAIFRGIIYATAGGQQVGTSSIPGYLLTLVSATAGGIPVIIFVAAAIVAATWAAMRYAPAGRSVYAVGSNPGAAVYYGLPAARIVWLSYAAEGLLAGFAGILLAAQVGSVAIDIATGWELQTLAAVVIGGLSLLGGSGSVAGAALGAVAIAAINDGLVVLKVQSYWQMFLQGAVIVLAVAFDFARRVATGRSGRDGFVRALREAAGRA
jgi:rhamnose transport system permease protein